MSKNEPTYLVELRREDDVIRSRVLALYPPLDDNPDYTVIESTSHPSISDALFDAGDPIADFMGRKWL
jgi:hypothetical protein